MTKVLIADSSKPSLVMSSEVFKDKIPGSIVVVAGTGAEMLRLVVTEKPDICLVDFDLPDVDGASLIVELRSVYSGPVLMTAFADDVVGQAVNELLFHFADASAWIPKPVRFEELATRIERFLLEKRRIGKRFDADLETKIIGKAEGRGKRAPKADGRLTNISMGGACISLASQMKMKKSQELTISIAFPVKGALAKHVAIMSKKSAIPAAPVKAAKGKPAPKPKAGPKMKTAETKFKAKVAWVTKGQIGIRFDKLSDLQRKGLEAFIRESTTIVLAAAANSVAPK
jgi:DNA-binding response OmpR family regulator